jgi:hypothetical protein
MKIGFVRTPAKAQNFTAILFYRKGPRTQMLHKALCVTFAVKNIIINYY